MDLATTLWPAALVVAVLALATAFKPWQVLRHAPLQTPWLVVLMLLPWVWWAKALLPSGLGLHLSGACLLVLMFGWPLAMLTMAAVGLLAALLTAYGPATAGALPVAKAGLAGMAPAWEGLATQILWAGMAPGTLALLLGLALRRWLPHHLFIYILGRGFFTSVIAIALAALLALAACQRPAGLSTSDWLLAHWLLAWGEGIATGMLVAIFVAFKPEWLLTYSDKRYLPDDRH